MVNGLKQSLGKHFQWKIHIINKLYHMFLIVIIMMLMKLFPQQIQRTTIGIK